MITLPGLIDPHVHLRYLEPEIEDFSTGTNAAIAGGFTMLLDMPNNNPPSTTRSRLREKIAHASKLTKADIGFYFGSLGDNLDEFEKIKDLVFGLKLYLNVTTGEYIIDKKTLIKIYKKWNEVTEGKKPILLHAEEDVMDKVSQIVRETKQPTHIVHVSSEKELSKILLLKNEGLPITTGVTPHHLFLTHEDEKKLGSFGLMKPRLKSKQDQAFLWKHFKDIDSIESDHAPHTKIKKESDTPPYGVPGLETTLALLLTAMHEKRITKEDIISKCYTQPKNIFHLPDQVNTFIEVDENESWTIENGKLFTTCNWTPFNDWKVRGRVKRVVIRSTEVFNYGRILEEPGFGKIITG
jgi:dihydroorotase